MKAILALIGLAFCLTGKAQQNSVEKDSLNFVNKANTLTKNSDIIMYGDNLANFGTISIEETKWEFRNTDDALTQKASSKSEQKQNYFAFLSGGFYGTSKGNVPFWMRSMQYGSVPLDGISVSLLAGGYKEYKKESPRKLIDWGGGFEGRLNAGNHSEFILIEAYAKLRLSIFELKGGRFREQIGLVDSTLSSGAFSLSGNALGVPKIEAGIVNFWNVPLTRGVIAIKGNIAHGWMGTQILNKSNTNSLLVPEIDAYLHQLSAYGRIGKANWKVKLIRWNQPFGNMGK